MHQESGVSVRRWADHCIGVMHETCRMQAGRCLFVDFKEESAAPLSTVSLQEGARGRALTGLCLGHRRNRAATIQVVELCVVAVASTQSRTYSLLNTSRGGSRRRRRVCEHILFARHVSTKSISIGQIVKTRRPRRSRNISSS